jgi:site-specific DNA-methyltransferase (adenine-specific)
MSKTRTSSFGTGKRESHDSSAFYSRQLYNAVFSEPLSKAGIEKIEVPTPGPWADQVYCSSSEDMKEVPDNSVALAFTSPPYNVGKDYDDDMTLQGYLDLIQNVGREV